MMKVLVRHPCGSFKIDVNEDMMVNDFIKLCSDKLKIEPKNISVFADFASTLRLDESRLLKECEVKNATTLYLQISNVAKREFIRENLVVDRSKGDNLMPKFFTNGGNEMPFHLKKLRREFGGNAVTVDFYNFRDQQLPYIDYQEESSCYAIRISKESITRFQKLLLQSRFDKDKILLLFGRINEYTGKVTVHCSLEPHQDVYENGIYLKDRDEVELAIDVAAEFGMRIVGMVIGHNGKPTLPITNHIALMAAEYQYLYGEYFTTVVFIPKGLDDLEVQAFQVTDSLVKLFSKSLISMEQPSDPSLIAFNAPIMTMGTKQTTCHINLCLCAIRIRETTSKVISHSFPSLSADPTELDYSRHISDNELAPTWYQFFDFNLLVFLRIKRLISERSLKLIASSILSKTSIPDQVLRELEDNLERSKTHS